MQRLRIIFCSYLAAGICWSSLGMPLAAAQERVFIVGSGSNVPVHLYQAWTTEFNKKNSNVQVQYLALGTSESIKQTGEGIGDFGGGEVPLTDEQAQGSKVTMRLIPTAVVGIVPIYNLPGNPELNFSGDLLGQIYLGTVKNWKDPRIAKLNPDAALPDLPITVVHRSDGKGSNYILTDFLSKTNSRFRDEVGRSPSPKWPLGVEANRGEDMVERVASTRGAVGYVELNFARNAGIGYGRVENASGHFVRATPASIEAACAALETSLSDDFRTRLTNAPGNDSYPIASFTWIYVPISSASPARRTALKQFLSWSLQEGQEVAKNMEFAPLPERVAAKAQEAVNSLK
jgi:phosphate transport system substrate-binding protein